jgi:hypothetical protein
VPNPNIYLHEIITIVGAGSEGYKRHTGAGWAARPREGRSGLVGIWQQSGSTGDWPRVVNLWEMNGWDHWADLLEHQYAGGEQPPALRRWWNEGLKYRSGGFDRILAPAPFSPTRQELIERNVRGHACIQEIATVEPGTVEQYLDAVANRWLPVAARRGLTLAGAYRTTMRDTEAVLLWSLPTLRDFTRHLADFWDGPETRAWAETARTWRTDYRETLLVPSRWCVTHPEWTERMAGEGAPAARRRRAPRRRRAR